MLDDKQLIIRAIEANSLEAREIALILRAAEERSRQLQSGAEAGGELAALVERVEVKSSRTPCFAEAAGPRRHRARHGLPRTRISDSSEATRRREALAHPWHNGAQRSD